VRELLHELRRIGAIAIRTKGSHQTWELPDGERIGLVVNHPGDNAGRREILVVERALAKMRGIAA
jgi:predicted RNA binding protein YcfA (HicA-like mRNA interferase family)